MTTRDFNLDVEMARQIKDLAETQTLMADALARAFAHATTRIDHLDGEVATLRAAVLRLEAASVAS